MWKSSSQHDIHTVCQVIRLSAAVPGLLLLGRPQVEPCPAPCTWLHPGCWCCQGARVLGSWHDW